MPGERSTVVALANHVAHDALHRRDWEEADVVASSVESRIKGAGGLDELRVNRWIACKERQGADAIAAEVEAWKPEQDLPEFQLARNVLLGNTDLAFTYVEALLDADRMHELKSWAITAPLRNDPRWNALGLSDP
jgi:hypothetical protein